MLPQSNTPGPSYRAEPSYRPDIDGLRALAILSVVLYHSGLVRLSGGFTGVDIFFVISGYLIGGHIWTEMRTGTFSYKRFYQRRAKRILPALYAVIVFTLSAGLLLLSPRDLSQLGRSAVAATVWGSNILFWGTANYFAGSSERNPLLMTWSLGVEEQFYLLVPLLMAVVARMRSRWVLAAIAAGSLGSFVFAGVMAGHHPMATFYLLPARAWELGAGVALAVYETTRQRKTASRLWIEIGGVVALGLMIAAIVAHRVELTASAWAVLPAVAGAALAIAVPGSWINRRLLSTPPLRFVGKISYSWYLWHWPLLALMHILCGGAIPAVREAETVALSFALAAVSYFLIEQPFRRSTQPAARMLARYAVASAILLAVCAGVWSSHGAPQRFPALARMEDPGEALRSDPCLAGLNRDAPNLSPACYDTAAGLAARGSVGRQPLRGNRSGASRCGADAGLRIRSARQSIVPTPDRSHAFHSAHSHACRGMSALQRCGSRQDSRRLTDSRCDSERSVVGSVLPRLGKWLADRRSRARATGAHDTRDKRSVRRVAPGDHAIAPVIRQTGDGP